LQWFWIERRGGGAVLYIDDNLNVWSSEFLERGELIEKEFNTLL